MKKLFLITLSFFVIFLFGCSKSSDDSNPIGFALGDGNNTGNVTIQVSILQDPQQGPYFHFTPSVDVKISKVEATLNNGQTTPINGDPNATISTTEGFSILVSNPAVGDKWTFTITGKIASNNADFKTTVNFTIPQDFGGGTGSVTFEISSQPGQGGSTEFLFKPSVDVKLSKVDVEMGGATDLLNGDDATVLTANTWYVLASYNNVTSGQQWSFTFTGKIAANNQDYTVTAKYTVP